MQESDMPDAFAESTALLEQLVRSIMNETDPAKIDHLAEIWRVLEEREHVRPALPPMNHVTGRSGRKCPLR
jgi:hypothetical protein